MFKKILTSKKCANNSGTEKIVFKIGCFDGSVVNGIRRFNFYSFVLCQTLGEKISQKPRKKLEKLK